MIHINKSDISGKFYEERYKDAEWYDEQYLIPAAEHYRGHYTQTHFHAAFVLLCLPISSEAKVLDIGCGPGQMGELLYDKGVRNYTGFDFSDKAIAIAKQKPTPEHIYHVADARTTDLFETVDYDTVVCSEFLEHVIDDVGIFDKIKSGTNLHIGVPNSHGTSHVRCFPTREDVYKRYGHMVANCKIEGYIFPNNTWTTWIMRGTKR